MLTLDRVYHASYVLKDVVRRTDVIMAPKMNTKGEVFLKTENLQVTGSFKIRGAYYKMSQLTQEEKDKGVVACSAGNHAQGVALAAKESGIRSIICLPDGAPISKVEATKNFGAEVCLVEGSYDDAYNKAKELCEEKNMTFVHPFDDEAVIAGQGTVALELMEQIPDLDAVVVPVGGGGLIAGVAYTVKSLNPRIKVYGVQSSTLPSMKASMENGEITELEPEGNTITDGIRVKKPGTLTYELCKQYVDEVVTVTDDETAAAILALMERQKLITEGAGAVAAAAVMFDKIPVEGKRVACILSGGNIDVTILNRVIDRGLKMTGRSYRLSVALTDKPGQLSQVAQIIAEHHGNVTGVLHEHSSEGTDVNGCYLQLSLETRNFEHIEEIRKALMDEGFKLL